MNKTIKRLFAVLLAAAMVFGSQWTLASTAYAAAEAASVRAAAEPGLTVIPPPTLKISDRYLTLSVEVGGADRLTGPVTAYYRADPSLPYTSITLQREGDTAVWSADIDTYVYFGQAKENRKFFTDTVYYHISAEYDTGTVTTEECVVQCDQYYGNVYDYSSLPYLLITEIVPATSAKGVGNGDKFEFIELYNNSDQPIDLSGYELHYMTAPSTRPTEYTWRKLDNTDIVIPARGTVVIWCNTNDWQNATALPASDMLEYYYGTEDEPKTDWNLPADFTFTSEGENANLTYTHFSGMPNSGQHRGWQLVTNTGELVVEAYYNVNNDTSNNTDVTSDYGIQFRYPTDGGKRMQKISANVVRANPGRVLTYQVPSATVDMPDDTEAPVINYAHRDTDIRAVEADGIDHEIWASVTDDTIVNTVWLEYKISSADYTPENTVLQSFLRDGETSFYCAYMDFGGFIRQSTFVYRIIARDIVGHETMTEWYSVNIIPYEDEIENTGLRTNIKNGDYVTGSVTLSATETDAQKAAGITMEIDGEPYEVSPDNETYALFVYEVYQTDFNFLNGVTIKNETFDTDTDHEILFNFDISGKWTTYTVRIPLDKILPTAENPDGGLIGLHCGNRYTPIYDPARFAAAIEAYRAAKAVNDAEGMRKASADFIYGDNRSKTEYDCTAELDETGYNLNRDDYEYRDVRLILPDGTVLYDTNPANGGKYSESNRDEIYKFSDSSASDTRQAYFKFDVPADKIDTRSVRIDTTQYADGEHTWTVKSGDTTETVTFYIDNTAPEFTFPFADGETLKGSLSLAPTVDETGSGVGRMYGYLDGNRVGIPYYVKSGTLEPGLHTLECTVEDGVGNVTTKTVTFRTEAETPDAPVLVSGTETVNGSSGTMSVQVSDPSGDAMTVEFYGGYNYTAADRDAFTAYHNSVNMEPPPYVEYPGDTAFTDEQYELVGKVDGQYMDSQSYDLPYQRFAVKVDPDIPRNESIYVRWYGKSFDGCKVTLYAWNIIEQEWDAMDYTIASGDNDFTLEAKLILETYVNVDTNVVNILVQDEVQPADDEKFTIAWVTDQQYYTQRNAYDDEDHVILELQHNWLIENRDALNLQYVISTGDVVNRQYEAYQWDIVSEYYRLLENARIPYGITAGNHDVNFSQEDYSEFGRVFGEDRYKDKSWYGESYQNNRGHYDTISVGGIDFMFVYMGWGIYQTEIDWMNKVISENPDKIVILGFHEYLGTSGVRTEIGEELYQKVVLPNPNVQMVLCGHLHGSSSRVDEIDDDGDGTPDRKVWQLLADYQGSKNTASNYEGGDGFMRLFTFDIANGTVDVTSYSPYLDYLNELRGLTWEEGVDNGAYNPYKALEHMDFEGLQGDGLAQNGNGSGSAYLEMDVETNSFVYAWALEPRLKRVATDALFVTYRQGTPFYTAENVASGTTVSAVMDGLQPDSRYAWFVRVTDDNGGEYISDMYEFSTGSFDTGGKGCGSSFEGRAMIVAAVMLLASGAAIAFVCLRRGKSGGAQ